MIWNSEHFIAAPEVVAVAAIKRKALNLERRERLRIEGPANRRNVPSQRLNVKIQQLIEIAVPILRRHLVLILPTSMIADAAVDSERCNGTDVAQELGNRVTAGIKLSQHRVDLRRFRAVIKCAVEHIAEDRHHNFRHRYRRVIADNREHRGFKPLQAPQEKLEIVAAHAERLVGAHFLPYVGIAE